MSTKTRTIFFGTPDFAVPFLTAITTAGYLIAAAVTAPDKATGRKQLLAPPPVKTAALKAGLPVFQPATLKDNAFFEKFLGLAPELCVVVAYGKIIPERYLSVPKYGFINVHPSLLPKYRGPSPIQSAILNGETETGVSIMLLDKDVDHGPILASEKLKVESEKYYPEVRDELTKIGLKLLKETLPRYISGEIKPQEQDHSAATFTKMLTREDGRLDRSEPAKALYDRVRALNPEPGTWAVWKGKKMNILRAHIDSGVLVPDIIQLEGGRPMPVADFINGHPDFTVSQLD